MNVVLTGPPGVGKSKVGLELAREMGGRHQDLDELIEARASQSVSSIFDAVGEAGFRDLEAAVLLEALHDMRARAGGSNVLSLGGGTLTRQTNRDAVKDFGNVVYLRSSLSTLIARIGRGGQRPLLAGDDREARLEALLAIRVPQYAEVASLILDTDRLTVSETVQLVLRQLGESSILRN